MVLGVATAADLLLAHDRIYDGIEAPQAK